ncbi:uncharacterized protein PV09_02185 [Verruconis gallopava]|uniref:N-alpha-acetyltransferase 40 n=1 Tax=Verruconis gallopava TaxID=253628 RepID=A0A0D1XX05_9PEZI|nr:uncharacterized protein PV09_02185 [Verruconis gallopava]KIW07336.1 hypothetical protein PV09_02185 [Verruconis gallopava]
MPSRRSNAKDTESFLSALNALDEAAFAKYLPSSSELKSKDGSKTYVWTFHLSSNLNDDDLEACFSLVEETSSADYQAASQGWNPDHKRSEMRERDMRYILVHRSGKEGHNSVLAFTSFMLTPEDDQPVIYIYEIHLSPELRGTGIGKALMEMVASIGRKVGVSMSMLTVFTTNQHAEAFYRRLGYTEDDSSPRDRKLRGGKIKRPEYLILSKNLREQANATTKRIKT